MGALEQHRYCGSKGLAALRALQHSQLMKKNIAFLGGIQSRCCACVYTPTLYPPVHLESSWFALDATAWSCSVPICVTTQFHFWRGRWIWTALYQFLRTQSNFPQMVQSLISGHRALPRNVFLAELHFHWVGQDFPDHYYCTSYVIDFLQLDVTL